MGSPVRMSQRRTIRSPPPVRSSDPSGRKASDQTGRPGPFRAKSALASRRSITAAEPPIVAAAIRAPSGERASATTGAGPVSISALAVPSALRIRTTPSAAPATISPSGAAAIPLRGEGRVSTRGSPEAGQILSVAS
jgi:hypothetical protein